MSEQHHDERGAVSYGDDPQVPHATTPVAALSREQVLDRLVALLRRGARPDDPQEAAK